jgi:tetratricopeptide (TPR) repeat protein
MGAADPRKSHEMRTLEFASVAMTSATAGDHAAARRAWQDALDYAEVHLPDDDIRFWVRSGLGAALLEAGDYRGALEMAGSALAWCLSQRAPLASLTMAKSYLRLGDVVSAQDYARQACGLRGEGVLQAFSPEDRAALGPITGGPGSPP